MTDQFSSVSTMIENLKADEVEKRLASVKGLHCIAQTLGPERTRNELLPYLTDYLDEDDNVLRAFALILGNMLADVGGVQFATALYEPLEVLCGLDEITVRDEVVNSMCNIAAAIFKPDSRRNSDEQARFIELLRRLAQDEGPQRRCCACGVIAAPFKHAAPPAKAELHSMFVQLCADEEVMVRRAACVALSTSAAAMFEGCMKDALQLYGALCRDPSDGVRLQAIPAGLALAPPMQRP